MRYVAYAGNLSGFVFELSLCENIHTGLHPVGFVVKHQYIRLRLDVITSIYPIKLLVSLLPLTNQSLWPMANNIKPISGLYFH